MMTLIEKVFALHAVHPFSRLHPSELLVVATAAIERDYPPGHVLCPRGGVMSRLHVRVAGEAVDPDGKPLQPVLGTTILLTGKPSPFPLLAGPSGYRALAIPRGKFFTIVHECPELLTGFFRLPLLGVDYDDMPSAPPP